MGRIKTPSKQKIIKKQLINHSQTVPGWTIKCAKHSLLCLQCLFSPSSFSPSHHSVTEGLIINFFFFYIKQPQFFRRSAVSEYLNGKPEVPWNTLYSFDGRSCGSHCVRVHMHTHTQKPWNFFCFLIRHNLLCVVRMPLHFYLTYFYDPYNQPAPGTYMHTHT